MMMMLSHVDVWIHYAMVDGNLLDHPPGLPAKIQSSATIVTPAKVHVMRPPQVMNRLTVKPSLVVLLRKTRISL